jgi:hypothetical protein
MISDESVSQVTFLLIFMLFTIMNEAHLNPHL